MGTVWWERNNSGARLHRKQMQTWSKGSAFSFLNCSALWFPSQGVALCLQQHQNHQTRYISNIHVQAAPTWKISAAYIFLMNVTKPKLLRIKIGEDTMFSYYFLCCCPQSTSPAIDNLLSLRYTTNTNIHRQKHFQLLFRSGRSLHPVVHYL